ncbi:MAG TPA: peptide chain release factor-like protein [Phycisphaerales bacterium]|nr:peptide chain release factor-like protein [Phycisphaerales bacterium]
MAEPKANPVPLYPCPHPACLSEEALLHECDISASRTGGPGGQNRNKLNTLVTITHRPTGVQAHAGERRSQQENKAVAVRRLRLALAVQVRTDAPPPPAPKGKTRESFLAALDASISSMGNPGEQNSELWRSRVGGTRGGKGGRIACNPDHHDYPALLAEALDTVADSAWEPKPAADRLGITPSQLIKLVKDHPAAMVEWNAQRAKRGGHPLK